MKHERFALEQASVYLGDQRVFSEFNLHIYQQSILGIICDSVTEEHALLELFRGNCRVEGKLRFDRKTFRRGSSSPLFQDCFFIIGSGLNLISSLSISENICIFADKRSFVYSSDYRARTEEYLKKFEITLDIDKPVNDLERREQLLVVLLKAYAENRKIIVLSGVSESVTESEYAPAEQLIRKMIPLGFTFVIIDSIDTNIFNSADEVMVIRGGTSVACFESEFFNRQSFYNYMLQGRNESVSEDSFSEPFFEDTEDLASYAVFSRVTTPLLDKVTFSLGKGEILKILCLDKQTTDGFRGLVNGTDKIISGSFEIGGANFRRPGGFDAAMAQGVFWCPESPYEQAVIGSMSLRDNIMLPLSEKVRALWMKHGYTRNIDQFIVKNLGIDFPGKRASSFSPEVLQRAVYLRLLISAPKVLFIEKPFTETDIRIRETTLEMIRLLERRGVTIILLISSPSTLTLIDGDELYAKNGRIISEEEMYRSFYGEQADG